MAWVKFRGGLNLKGTAPRTAARRARVQELLDRSWALARHIHKHGTKPQPYVAPTSKKMQPRVLDLLRSGVRNGIAAAMNSKSGAA